MPKSSPNQKLVIFTEHRDTLSYLQDRIETLFGKPNAIVIIHGGMGREDRQKAQESFKHDPEVRILLATDAAGEGINLQRAHLMVNYDLPWNPNRLEQRFGRIHRIGQTEVCHLWNLVAPETREGDVYYALLRKLEEARKALKGQVYDVLGKLHFEGSSLRRLMIEAIRYGSQPEVRAKLHQRVEHAANTDQLRELVENHDLVPTLMDDSQIRRVREEMERAEARRLQPHYIQSFFLEAFIALGGTVREREKGRLEVPHVPVNIRRRDRQIGFGEPVLPRYERITFERDLVTPQGAPMAAFVAPGHPLFESVVDITLEQHREMLRHGAVLVDRSDPGTAPKAMFYLEHSLQDATTTAQGNRRVVSKRMMFITRHPDGTMGHFNYAPYLDYSPLGDSDPTVDEILARPECGWLSADLEKQALSHAMQTIVPEHLREVSSERIELLDKTAAAVKARMTDAIRQMDNRANQLKAKEEAGKANYRLSSGEARRRADDLQARLHQRLEQLAKERQISALPPRILGGVLLIPQGLLDLMRGHSPTAKPSHPVDTQVNAARARAAVMAVERRLGFEPVDRELEKLGYDIESRDPKSGKLRFIEVKGRVEGADTITVTRNEILYSLNKPEEFILGIVEFGTDGSERVRYVRKPFSKEPEFHVVSANIKLSELLDRAKEPS